MLETQEKFTFDQYQEALEVDRWHMSDKSEKKPSQMTIEQAEHIIYMYNINY